jgi:hypothetical protein
VHDLPLHQQRTMCLQRHEALPQFALAFLNKASQPCSLVACSYQYVAETMIFEDLLYKIQLWPALVQKEDA